MIIMIQMLMVFYNRRHFESIVRNLIKKGSSGSGSTMCSADRLVNPIVLEKLHGDQSCSMKAHHSSSLQGELWNDAIRSWFTPGHNYDDVQPSQL